MQIGIKKPQRAWVWRKHRAELVESRVESRVTFVLICVNGLLVHFQLESLHSYDDPNCVSQIHRNRSSPTTVGFDKTSKHVLSELSEDETDIWKTKNLLRVRQ